MPMASDTITPQVEPAKGAILVSRRLLQAILETEVGIPSPQLRSTPEHERESPTRQRYIHTSRAGDTKRIINNNFR
jgi:hypothetical protein